jgi:tetratricopeptide (TPR) repeat protein
MTRFGPLWSLLRARPLLAALAGVVVLAAAGLAGTKLYADARLRAARQAWEEERHAAAGAHVEACLRVWPRSSEAHLLAARIARGAGDYPEAERHLNECRRLLGTSSEAVQLEWLLLRVQGGEADELAAGLWRTVEQDHPDSDLILEALARTYMRDLRLGPALACLDRWLKRSPGTARALDWRGWVLEKMQNEEEARRAYEQALALQPGRHAVRRRLVQMLLGLNRTGEARAHLDYLRGHRGEHEDDQLDWARLHVLEGNLGQARQELEAFLRRHPDDPAALAQRGKLALARSRPAEAERYLRQAEKLAPAEADVLYQLERCLRQQPGRQSDADGYLRRYQRARANHKRLAQLLSEKGERLIREPRAAAEVGRLLLELGLDRPARYWLEAALKKDEHLPEAHQALAEYHRRAGNAREAEHHHRLARQAAE